MSFIQRLSVYCAWSKRQKLNRSTSWKINNFCSNDDHSDLPKSRRFLLPENPGSVLCFLTRSALNGRCQMKNMTRPCKACLRHPIIHDSHKKDFIFQKNPIGLWEKNMRTHIHRMIYRQALIMWAIISLVNTAWPEIFVWHPQIER
jgi:hypothetical protein